MADKVSQVISKVFEKLFPSKTFNLSTHQYKAISEFVRGKDTFVSLPTGHGKSLIYQLAIPLANELRDNHHGFQDRMLPEKPLLLVVSPLQALVADQINSCKLLGLSCVKLEDLTSECIANIIFTSPEMLEKHLDVLRMHGDRFIGVVVDESHCVVNWGTAKEKTPFPISYSRVGNIRALVKAPILCLTATASQKTRKKIIKMLHMTKTTIIYLSPEKKNIKFAVEEPSKERTLDMTIGWLIRDLKDNREQTEKTVIFCSSFKECGDIYEVFEEFLPSTSNVAMFHARTPERIKSNVLSDFIQINGNIRVVVATSALGMGVDIPNIRRVIHYGVPQDMESYKQAVGRGGRDGGNVNAVLYSKNYHLRHCDEKMSHFVRNKEECRRLQILKYFKQRPRKNILLHRCCDMCSLKCKCGSCPDELYKQQPVSSVEISDKETLNRHVTDEEKETFTSVLKDIRKEQSRNGCASVLGAKFLENMLSDSVIEELADNLRNLFSAQYIMENFPIVDERVAAEVLSVVDDMYKDVTEATRVKLLDLDWNDHDFYFPSVLESSCVTDTSEDSD